MKVKRVAFVAGAVVLLVLGAVSLRDKFGPQSVLAAPSHDVLILNCLAPGWGLANSFHHEGSSGAPAVTATTCAQGIADAHNAGFRTTSVTPGNSRSNLDAGVVYTLERGGDN